MKQGDENELESNLRLEKVVASKQLRLAVETEEKRLARLENSAATKLLMLAMEMDEERIVRLEKMVVTSLAMETDEERKAKLEKMVATAQLMLALIKGVVDVGVDFVLLKPFLKIWQLCLSFKLDVLTTWHPQLKEI